MKFINNFHILILSISTLASFGAFHLFDALPKETSDLFSGSGNCITCHSAATGVLSTPDGRDISPPKHWQSSMMANAAKDPFWQAKVSAESIENPHIKSIIEDKCTTCHAPMGRTEAKYNNAEGYTLSKTQSDPLSLDGVSCTVCHQIQPTNFDSLESFSGGYLIQNTKEIFGPYQNPNTKQMEANTGYTPIEGSHLKSSALCATCHTLITPFLDADGELAGYFPEQMPYFEWKNSIYSEKSTTCQKCHMPHNSTSTKISSRPGNLSTLRSPIFEHHFVGGNITLNRILHANTTTIGVESTLVALDSTQLLTEKNLNTKSTNISLNSEFKEDYLEVGLMIENKTGHKFPTGFPSRIVWIHLSVKDSNGNVLFESGSYSENGTIKGLEEFEPHYDTITQENQVQAYQAVMGNTDNAVTYTLLRAAKYLKDNRIPPKGFKYDQPYDSLIAVTGSAYHDSNFNRSKDGVIGSGSDKIIYRIPLTPQKLTVDAKLCYQPVLSHFINHLNAITSNESTVFKSMFNSLEIPKTFIIASASDNLIATRNITSRERIKNIILYPNPATTNSVIEFKHLVKDEVEITFYNIEGKLISMCQKHIPKAGIISVNLSDVNLNKRGIYFVTIKGRNTDFCGQLLIE